LLTRKIPGDSAAHSKNIMVCGANEGATLWSTKVPDAGQSTQQA
jgi:hypothetical protein